MKPLFIVLYKWKVKYISAKYRNSAFKNFFYYNFLLFFQKVTYCLIWIRNILWKPEGKIRETKKVQCAESSSCFVLFPLFCCEFYLLRHGLPSKPWQTLNLWSFFLNFLSFMNTRMCPHPLYNLNYLSKIIT